MKILELTRAHTKSKVDNMMSENNLRIEGKVDGKWKEIENEDHLES